MTYNDTCVDRQYEEPYEFAWVEYDISLSINNIRSNIITKRQPY